MTGIRLEVHHLRRLDLLQYLPDHLPDRHPDLHPDLRPDRRPDLRPDLLPDLLLHPDLLRPDKQ